jgi:hypothetical protein
VWSISTTSTVADINALKENIFTVLRQFKVENLVNTPGEVAFDLRNVRISIVHLPFNGPNVHQIVMGGGTGDVVAETNLMASNIAH